MLLLASSVEQSCAHSVINNDKNDLRITATYNRNDAEKALVGSNAVWVGDNRQHWLAGLTHDCCGVYSVEFEVLNTWEVLVFTKRTARSRKYTFVKVRELALIQYVDAA